MIQQSLLLYSALLLHPLLVSAAGTGTNDGPETVGYVQEDNQRDTMGLLFSCLATLGLCVFSAVHLNIPPKDEPFYKAFWRELQWCTLSLFAPELTLYTAWRQFASARELCDVVQEVRKAEMEEQIQSGKTTSSSDLSASEKQELKEPWTLMHGFYATMGGFAIDLDETNDLHVALFGKKTKRITLTAKGVALAAQCGHLADITIPIHVIEDKNKTDALGKFLVCAQTGWMLIQVISRPAFGLPSTLLEVHTVAHIIAALFLYLIWWKKPRHIDSPTLLKGDWVWPLVAYMYSASRLSGKQPAGIFGRFMHPKPELKKLAYFEHMEAAEHAIDANPIQPLGPDRTPAYGHFGPRPSLNKTPRNGQESHALPIHDEIESERLRLAAEAVTRYPTLRSKFQSLEIDQSHTRLIPSNCFVPYATELVQSASIDWPNAGLLRRTYALVMGMVLWGVSAVYGAIHLAAWNYYFPTRVEQLFWHVSSAWVTFCAVFWLVTNFLAHYFPLINRTWEAYADRKLGWISTVIITSLVIFCGTTYVVCRMFLVVEAFVSIRRVPKAVYETPSWSQVFPHF